MLWFKFEADSKQFSINSSIDIEISTEKLDLWKDKIMIKRTRGRKVESLFDEARDRNSKDQGFVEMN